MTRVKGRRTTPQCVRSRKLRSERHPEALAGVGHCQFLISGRSCPCTRMYSPCSTSLKLHLVEGGESAPVDSFAVDCSAVGHRVVHGGSRFVEPVVIDEEVKAAIRELTPLAPLHNAPALEAIEAAQQALPNVPHVAVFDTAFHATMP